jgi:hypothetical protein
MRTLILISFAALILSLSACKYKYRGEEVQMQMVRRTSQIADDRATEKVTPEIVKLQASKPIKSVEVIVLDKALYGWWDAINRRIYIVNRGTGQNIKTLRHEWEHARQWDAGEPYSERKAYDAELEAP